MRIFFAFLPIKCERTFHVVMFSTTVPSFTKFLKAFLLLLLLLLLLLFIYLLLLLLFLLLLLLLLLFRMLIIGRTCVGNVRE